jgi:hypothetical protein
MCLSESSTLVQQLQQLVSDHAEAHMLRSELAAGESPLYDPFSANTEKIATALERSRKLRQDGLLYSTDFPLRYGQVLGEDSSVS